MRHVPVQLMATGFPSMPHGAARAVTLTCHSQTPTDVVRSIDVSLHRSAGGLVAVRYTISGDLDRLRIPPARPPGIAERLWQHTCCEIFIRREGLSNYHELNFAPSGQWTAYAFERYREGAPLPDEALDPQIVVRRGVNALELDAIVRLGRLSPAHTLAKLAVAVSAVIEDRGGALSYWSLAHPAGTPDFHHPDAFALELDEVRN